MSKDLVSAYTNSFHAKYAEMQLPSLLGSDIFNKSINSLYNDNLQISESFSRTLNHINDLKIKTESYSLVPDFNDVSNRTTKEILFDACANVKILTSKVSMHLNSEFRNNLFIQIDRVHEPKSWNQDDEPVNQLSFNSFLRWYLLNTPEQGPGIGLSPLGNLVAAWMVGRDRLIIEFLPKDKTKWLISRYYNDEKERGSGQTSISRLSAVLSPYNVDTFFKEKD